MDPLQAADGESREHDGEHSSGAETLTPARALLTQQHYTTRHCSRLHKDGTDTPRNPRAGSVLGQQTHRWSPKGALPTALPPHRPCQAAPGGAAQHTAAQPRALQRQEEREGANPPRAGRDRFDPKSQGQGSSFLFNKENVLTPREFKVIFVRDWLEGRAAV